MKVRVRACKSCHRTLEDIDVIIRGEDGSRDFVILPKGEILPHIYENEVGLYILGQTAKNRGTLETFKELEDRLNEVEETVLKRWGYRV